jgi:DNA-binding SARP family transcriptional activator
MDSSQERANANLRSALWRLKKLHCEVVDGRNEHLSMARGVTVDVDGAVAAARRLTSTDTGMDATDITQDVGTLVGAGELLPDWYDDWVLIERERIRQVCLHALEIVCQRLTRAGDYARAVEAGLAAVTGEPLRESAHRVLIEAYLAEGNVCEALRQYRYCARLLAADLGVEPSERLSALFTTVGIAGGGLSATLG